MAKIEVTPGLITALRTIYGHACPVCGEQMTMVDSMGPVYACDGKEADPEHPGRVRNKAGRRPPDEHYNKSRRYLRSTPDPAVVAVLDAYEALLRAQEKAGG